MRARRSHWWRAGLATLVAAYAFAALALPADAAKPPQGRVYFTADLGLDEGGRGPLAAGVSCIAFSDTEFLCGRQTPCGTWKRIQGMDQTKKQTAFKVEFQITGYALGGGTLFFEGTGIVENRGPKHTIAMVFRAHEPVSGWKINFGQVGKPTRWDRCLELFEEFYDDTP